MAEIKSYQDFSNWFSLLLTSLEEERYPGCTEIITQPMMEYITQSTTFTKHRLLNAYSLYFLTYVTENSVAIHIDLNEFKICCMTKMGHGTIRKVASLLNMCAEKMILERGKYLLQCVDESYIRNKKIFSGFNIEFILQNLRSSNYELIFSMLDTEENFTKVFIIFQSILQDEDWVSFFLCLDFISKYLVYITAEPIWDDIHEIIIKNIRFFNKMFFFKIIRKYMKLSTKTSQTLRDLFRFVRLSPGELHIKNFDDDFFINIFKCTDDSFKSLHVLTILNEYGYDIFKMDEFMKYRDPMLLMLIIMQKFDEWNKFKYDGFLNSSIKWNGTYASVSCHLLHNITDKDVFCKTIKNLIDTSNINYHFITEIIQYILNNVYGSSYIDTYMFIVSMMIPKYELVNSAEIKFLMQLIKDPKNYKSCPALYSSYMFYINSTEAIDMPF